MLNVFGAVVFALGAQLSQTSVSPQGEQVLVGCLVKAERDVRIASEEGGVLIDVPVKEGDRVRQGQTLALVDDRQAKAALHVADIALNAADKRAKDDVERRYAIAAAKVAQVDWQKDIEANRDSPGAVPESEIRRKELDFKRATLQIERAQKEQVLAGLDADTKRAERDAAQTNLERLTIAAPFDGQVVSVFRDSSEWVSPGDPVMRLIRFDQMHVEAFVYSRDFDPVDLLGRSVTVEVSLARGRSATFKGKVIHCGQIVQSDGSYLVRAEVENQRVGEVWVIRPGLETSMTVHTSKAAARGGGARR